MIPIYEAKIEAESVTRAYNRYAGIYRLSFGWILHHGRTTLSKKLNARPGERILEIGVGSGLMLPLYPRGVSVLGIDLSENMLKRARRMAERHRLDHVELQLGDAELTDLPSDTFDHVVLPYVYSVTPNPLVLMRQAFRMCKPGGSIWVLNHFSESTFWAFMERPFRSWGSSIGFRSHFPYGAYIAAQNWDIQAVYKVNLFALSRLVHIRNGSREA